MLHRWVSIRNRGDAYAFRAQNRGFCALFGFGTPIFGRFEHKIGIFVLGKRGKWHREGERDRSSKTKSSEGRQRCRSCKTKSSEGRQPAPWGRQPALRGADNQHSEGLTTSTPGRQPAPRGAEKEVPDKRHQAPSRRGRAPGALRLQLLLVGCVLWVEVGPAGKPVV